MVDEAKDRYDTALESEQSAKAVVATAKAHVIAAEIKVEQAKAEIIVAQADVKVAQAKVEKAQVLRDFATITAPFDGVVTHRGNYPGDFIPSAVNAKRAEPLLIVERTDLRRVIVSVPERDAPFIYVGNTVELEIDALPGKKWSAKVSRIAPFLDPQTGGMRVEIDLPNPTGQVYPGMSGRATIVFGKSKE